MASTAYKLNKNNQNQNNIIALQQYRLLVFYLRCPLWLIKIYLYFQIQKMTTFQNTPCCLINLKTRPQWLCDIWRICDIDSLLYKYSKQSSDNNTDCL